MVAKTKIRAELGDNFVCLETVDYMYENGCYLDSFIHGV